MPVVPKLEEAVELIHEMVEETRWLEPADQSRWICMFLEPAFKSLRPWSFPTPLFVMEADASQAGKGFLLNLVNATYNEIPAFVVKTKKGVGSFDEALAEAMLKAKPIVLIDNFRGRLDSEILEAAQTLPPGGTIGARVPYHRQVQVSPHAFIFQLSSNGLITTEDQGNRSCICRILFQGERPWKRYPEGSILERVRARQPKVPWAPRIGL